VRTVFNQKSLPLEWVALRSSAEKTWSLSERPGFLRLYTLASTLRDTKPVSFLCRRQQHINWKISASVEFSPAAENESAGLSLFRGEDFLYRFEICLIGGTRSVRLVRSSGGADEVIASRLSGDGSKTFLAVTADGQNLEFAFGSSPDSPETLAKDVDAFILSTEKAGGFIGTVLGVHASGNGKNTGNHADIEWFEYTGM
jgi:alpha-N-arabinofuranosidase